MWRRRTSLARLSLTGPVSECAGAPERARRRVSRRSRRGNRRGALTDHRPRPSTRVRLSDGPAASGGSGRAGGVRRYRPDRPRPAHHRRPRLTRSIYMSGRHSRGRNAVLPRESVAEFGYRQDLLRRVGLVDLIFYGLIFMVPIAPFAIFGSVYQASGGMPVLAYLVGMVALLFTASSYAQMVRAFPLSGSVYNYAGRGIGAPVGFLTGWAILLDYTLVPGLLYLVAAVAMNSTLPQVPVWAWLVAFVELNTVINLRGIRMSMTFTKIMIVAELGVLALYLSVGVWAIAQGKGHGFSLSPLFNPHTFSWPALFGSVSVAVLSFLGFDGISMLVEEATGGSEHVGRAVPLAAVLAGVVVVPPGWGGGRRVPRPGPPPAGRGTYGAPLW